MCTAWQCQYCNQQLMATHNSRRDVRFANTPEGSDEIGLMWKYLPVHMPGESTARHYVVCKIRFNPGECICAWADRAISANSNSWLLTSMSVMVIWGLQTRLKAVTLASQGTDWQCQYCNQQIMDGYSQELQWCEVCKHVWRQWRDLVGVEISAQAYSRWEYSTPQALVYVISQVRFNPDECICLCTLASQSMGWQCKYFHQQLMATHKYVSDLRSANTCEGSDEIWLLSKYLPRHIQYLQQTTQVSTRTLNVFVCKIKTFCMSSELNNMQSTA